jgi:protein SCO1/2
MAFLLLLAATMAGGAAERPSFDPRIGAQLDPARHLLDSTGADTTLAAVLAGKPALVIFGYDKCPNLCGVTQQAVASDLRKTGLDPATYRALFISIDKTETHDYAATEKYAVIQTAGPDGMKAWRFLTGSEGAALAREAGISFDTRPRIDQFVHPVAVLAITPGAKISRVLPALTFEPRDLRLALVEASAGKLGTIADHVFLLCAGFDTSKGQYTPAIWAALKLGGVATLLALGSAILLLARRRT